MFDSLAEKLQSVFSGIRGRGVLSEEDVTRSMREIRLALLEADVNFKVVKEFTDAVRERCLGAEVIGRLNPGQQVIKIVNEELVAMMGGENDGPGVVFAPSPPTVILMAGLQGSGKTTAAAKLARLLRTEYRSSVALAACDLQRPAAVEQLVRVGEQAGATVYQQGTDGSAVDVARWALERTRTDGKDVLIVDTAGRLHIDSELMDELVAIRDATNPQQVMLVVDAMTGQDAVNVAEEFAAAVDFDGWSSPSSTATRAAAPRCRCGRSLGDPFCSPRPGEARCLRALPPRPDGAAHPRHGGRADADREGRARDRRR